MIKSTTNNPTINHAMIIGILEAIEKLDIKYHAEQRDMLGFYINDKICYNLIKSGHIILCEIIKPVIRATKSNREQLNRYNKICLINLDEKKATVTIMVKSAEKKRTAVAEYNYADPKCFDKIQIKTAELIKNYKKSKINA